MSDVFGIDQQGQRNLEEDATLNPLAPGQVQPTFGQGLLSGVTQGVMRGGVKALDALTTAGSMLDAVGQANAPNERARKFNAGITHEQLREDTLKLKEDVRKQSLDYWTPQPGEVGAAGRVLGGLSEMAIPLALGAGNPSLLLGSATLDTGKTLVDQGVDSKTASIGAVLTDVALAAGFKIPFLGSSWSTRVASGVAGNIALGGAMTEGQKLLLGSSGYQELAKQYGYTGENMALDALMGAVFGGLAHLGSPKKAQDAPQMTPDQVDALLAAKNAQHFQHDTAPGLPANAGASVAHQDALGAAVEQLLKGEPVNVPDAITQADFIKPPTQAENPISRAMKAEYPDLVKPQGLAAIPQAERQALPYNAPELNAYASEVEQKYGLPPGLINAIKNAGEKSGSKSTSPKGAQGVMQFTPENLKKYGVTDPTDPMQMIDAAGRYLSDTAKQYGGNVDAMIADYNGGPKQAAKVLAGKAPGAKETRDYLARVKSALEDPQALERQQQIDKTSLSQQSKQDLGRLYSDAARVKPVFDSTLSQIANEAGGEALTAPLKGIDRAAAKAQHDYGGDATQIKDLVRGTILVDEPSAAQAAVDLIGKQFEIVGKPRNLFDPSIEPVDGYRDAKFNVRVGGHVAEIQVNMPEMAAAKEAVHVQYEERSKIERESAGRQRTAEENAKIDELNRQMRAVYNAAWESAQARALGLSSDLNSSGVSGDPLRLAASGSNSRGGTVSQAAQEMATPGTLPSDTGTPSTSKNSAAMGTPPAAIIAGRKTNVMTERGMTVPTRYAVTDIGSLVTSHGNDMQPNPAFPRELQPRDRARMSSEAQIAKIENALNPELLGASARASDGAPIIGADRVVESGNARTIALRRAYGSGKADGYRQWLIDNAEQFGLDPAVVAQMDTPALVRIGSGDYNRAEFARQANESAVAQMSVTEIAKSDAARLSDLMGLVTNEDGTINMTSSAPFVQNFMAHIVSPSEFGAMMTADGQLSQQGLQRIRNAVFAKAYGDPDVVALMAESTDANIKNVLGGMLRAAPGVARLRDLIDAGARYPIDVSGDLAVAVRKFSELRAKGLKVQDMLDQGTLFDSGLTPEVKNLMIGLDENARAPKRVAEMVGRIVDQVDRLGDPRQGSLFAPVKGETGRTVEQVNADMLALEQQVKARIEARTGKPEPKVPDITVWNHEEMARLHDLKLELPTQGSEREAAKARIQQRIAARRGNPLDSNIPSAADLINSAIDSVRKDFEVKPVAGLFDSPEIQAARKILEDSPDARVVREDGTEVSVREAFKEVDDAQTAAQTDVKAFDAAITCYMGQPA